MTTIKTDDLTPAQINMLVAVAEGWVPHTDPLVGELRKIWRDTPPLRAKLQAMERIWLPRRDLDARVHYGPPMFCSEDDDIASRIIDREHIATVWFGGSWGAFIPGLDRTSQYPDDARYIDATSMDAASVAESRIEAAMRAYVRKVYGDTIATTDKPWLLEAAAS